MELPSQRRRLSEPHGQHFYCYSCDSKFMHTTRVVNALASVESKDQCKLCGSEFIEAIATPIAFRPKAIARYDRTALQGEDDLDSDDSNEPPYRIVSRTIRLSSMSPFVSDVLVSLFPHVFRQASIERLETIRNLLSTLSIFQDSRESTTGPTSAEYIASLKRQVFSELKNTTKIESCPICTDSFAMTDWVVGLECGHFFHELCILPWLNLNNSCPNCRKSLPRRDT